MKAAFEPILGKMATLWQGISLSQRLFLAVLSSLLIVVFAGLLLWLTQPEFSLLYSNLSPEDANRVVKSLETQQVPFKIEQNGTAIMVPYEKVHALRISIAGENILTGKGIGFEIFNDVKVGQTEFVQKLNYRRALEGELSRTVGEFPSIESARVHLVMPQRSFFIEEQQKPSAAVLIKLSGSKKLDQKDIEAIVNMIVMSVEGLDKGRVSVADTTGAVLYHPDDEGSLTGMSQTQFEHKQMTQQNLERRIEELLMPVVGVGHVRAMVNADLDFSQRTIRKELYDPESSVVRSEQRSEETTQGSANISGGVPDPNFRGDGNLGSLSDQNSNRETRTTNFEINKEELNIVSNSGEISRLTISVIVDGTYQADEAGEQIFTPRSDEEINRIRSLVSNAIGYDSARGDTIEVSSMAFENTDIGPAIPISSIVLDYAVRFGKPLLNVVLAFLFLVLIVRPVVLALVKPKVEGRMMIEELEGLPHTEERLALVDDSDEAVAATMILEKIEDIKAHALQMSEQNMDQALGIIKRWLKDSEEAKKLSARAA